MPLITSGHILPAPRKAFASVVLSQKPKSEWPLNSAAYSYLFQM